MGIGVHFLFGLAQNERLNAMIAGELAQTEAKSRRTGKPSQAGRQVHHSTIARWNAQGWRPVAHRLHPLEAGAVLHVRRVKNGTPSTHLLRGDELRALRRLQRESETSPFVVFVSERGSSRFRMRGVRL